MVKVGGREGPGAGGAKLNFDPILLRKWHSKQQYGTEEGQVCGVESSSRTRPRREMPKVLLERRDSPLGGKDGRGGEGGGGVRRNSSSRQRSHEKIHQTRHQRGTYILRLFIM
jgi:hypothetical protein